MARARARSSRSETLDLIDDHEAAAAAAAAQSIARRSWSLDHDLI